MDWLPPGGLEKLFADYDRIVSHHGAHDAPTNVQETPKPPSQPIEAAQIQPPEEWYGPRPLTAKKERDAQRMKDTGGYDLGDHMLAGEQRLKTKEDQQQQQQGDLANLERKQRDGFDPWSREDAANERLQHNIRNPNGASFQEDEQGLVNAYNDMTSTGVYYDPNTRTEYVKGSVTKRDWLDDFTKVPFWGDTRDSERYQQAESAYNDLQASGHPVDRVVGHSLGGSVALQLQKDKHIPKSRTFGAPVFDLAGSGERYRHPLDPVSVLDRGATWGRASLYPHTYTGYERFDK